MKTLVVTANPYFLDWLKLYPYDVKILKYNKNLSRIKKAFFWTTLKFRLKLLSYRYDVIFNDWFDELAVIMSKVSSKKIFIRLHRTEAYDLSCLKNANVDNIKCIITVSEYYKNIVDEIFNGKIPVHVIYNGVDTNKFDFNPAIQHPLKICTVGNLIPRKRVFDLIINNPDLEISIGGDGEEKMILQNTIKRFSLKSKIFGFVDLPDFYYNHDIFIMNSSDESFGVALIEAMSCGLIPLSFSRPEVYELIPDCLIYDNYDELREKITKLNNMSDAKLLSIKRKMRLLVESKFSLEHQTKCFLSLFSENI